MSTSIHGSGNSALTSCIYGLFGCATTGSTVDANNSVNPTQSTEAGPTEALQDGVTESTTSFLGTLQKVCDWSINFFLKIGSWLPGCIGNYFKNWLEARTQEPNPAITFQNSNSQSPHITDAQFQQLVFSRPIGAGSAAEAFYHEQDFVIFPLHPDTVMPINRLFLSGLPAPNLRHTPSFTIPSPFNGNPFSFINSIFNPIVTATTSEAVVPTTGTSIHPSESDYPTLSSFISLACEEVRLFLNEDMTLKALVLGNESHRIIMSPEALEGIQTHFQETITNSDVNALINSSVVNSEMLPITSHQIQRVVQAIFNSNVSNVTGHRTLSFMNPSELGVVAGSYYPQQALGASGFFGAISNSRFIRSIISLFTPRHQQNEVALGRTHLRYVMGSSKLMSLIFALSKISQRPIIVHYAPSPANNSASGPQSAYDGMD